MPLSMDNTKGQKENENGVHWGRCELLRVRLSEWEKKKKIQTLRRYPGSQNPTGCHHAREEDHFAVCSFTAASARRQVQTQTNNQSCFTLKRVSSSKLNPGRAHVFHLSYSCVQPQKHSKSYDAELLLSFSLSSKLPTNLWQMGEHWNLKCWWMLQGSDIDLLHRPALPHPFPQVLQAAPITIMLRHTLARAGPMDLFSSWSCCAMLDTWTSPGLPLPASAFQNYLGSKTSSTFPEASFPPQPRQKQLVT